MKSAVYMMLVACLAVGCRRQPEPKAKGDTVESPDIQEEYMNRILRRRMGEARLLWGKAAGQAEQLNVLLDFRFFADTLERATALSEELKENYEVTVSHDEKTEYWFIDGTTRPAQMELDLSMVEQWVDFMVAKGFVHGCVFTSWRASTTNGQSWSSEDIESEE